MPQSCHRAARRCAAALADPTQAGTPTPSVAAPTCLLSGASFFFQAEDGIRDYKVTGVQTCALPIYLMRLWAKPGVSAPSLGMEPLAAAVRRIDETLWASRYRSLVGDYENAKIYSQEIGRASCRERV